MFSPCFFFFQEETHVFKLIGQAKPHIMYLTGGDELMPEVESLSVLPVLEEEEGNLECTQTQIINMVLIGRYYVQHQQLL